MGIKVKKKMDRNLKTRLKALGKKWDEYGIQVPVILILIVSGLIMELVVTFPFLMVFYFDRLMGKLSRRYRWNPFNIDRD